MGDEYANAHARLSGLPPATATATAKALALVNAVVTDTTAAPEDLLAALTVLRHLREEIAGWEPQLITAARDQGVSWASLAPALGVTSRQAAERRYLRLRPSATGEHRGEDRVRAERTRRAGDRAVAEWARRNSSVLRQLAGQVSAVQGLSGTGQRRVDAVGRALGQDDPAALLSPLADSHRHLLDSHSGLAERIASVTGQSDQVRQATRDHRGRTQEV
ncbi:HSP18 transcriptional regulator [Kutzneria sp. NPDC052558]|uniref:HSP18 transcriptional regulator n=1 Tax=Kutzneria sp. NPDC052558 TaxID=3364121 RepID=UPI0037CB6985